MAKQENTIKAPEGEKSASTGGGDELKHRLAEKENIPIPGEQFESELTKVCAEIKAWKDKFDNSARVQLAAKMGRRPNFSKEATAENIKDYLTDEIGQDHLNILRKNPATYASRIAVVASTIDKSSGFSDIALKKILIQVAVGNYNTEVKVGKKIVETISSVNLKVVLRVQSLYFDAYIRECKKVVTGLKSKIEGFKDNAYKQQRAQIISLIEKIQSNAMVVNEYKHYALSRGISEKEKNLSDTPDILLNLAEFDGGKIDEKRVKALWQNTYNIVQVIRGSTLLFPLGHGIADKVITYGKYQGEEHPLGYFVKGQLYADEYLLAFRGMRKCYREDKVFYGRKTIEKFKLLNNYYNLAYRKIGTNTDPGLKAAIAISFAEYLLNFHEIHGAFLVNTLKIKPLTKEWLSPLLIKTKNGLMSIDSSSRVEDLYLRLEDIGSSAGIPQ